MLSSSGLLQKPYGLLLIDRPLTPALTCPLRIQGRGAQTADTLRRIHLPTILGVRHATAHQTRTAVRSTDRGRNSPERISASCNDEDFERDWDYSITSCEREGCSVDRGRAHWAARSTSRDHTLNYTDSLRGGIFRTQLEGEND